MTTTTSRHTLPQAIIHTTCALTNNVHTTHSANQIAALLHTAMQVTPITAITPAATTLV